MINRLIDVRLVTISALFCANLAAAGDWPQWRYDAARSAQSPHALPAELHLQWVRQLPRPRPAWPASQPSLRFDTSYEPVAAGGLLYVPSMVTDTVTAYDTETGRQVWQFFTDGPVRLAPSYGNGKLYFGSDDGHLYCVAAAKGTLLWKVRGGPTDRKILGNERLISTWPVRGGPVLNEGVVYFTAGIWPFMGIFVHAVDAQSGTILWTNSGDSIDYQINPHDSSAFGGFVPRGHLAITPKGLQAPGGRTPPGTYDLKTGKLIDFQFAKRDGRSEHGPVEITAGSRTYDPDAGKISSKNWEGRIEGHPWTMLAADDRLFVVTVEGKIYCFGQHQRQPTSFPAPANLPDAESNEWQGFVDDIVRKHGMTNGYALVHILSTIGLAEALVQASDLHVIVIDSREEKVDSFRRRMIDAGWYGTRVVAHVGGLTSYRLPPYFASLIVSLDSRVVVGDSVGTYLAATHRALRPYGGVALLPFDAQRAEDSLREANLTNAQITPVGMTRSLLRRPGPLPGAGDWTHQYADPANSVVSQDSRVKLPLGLLWFGGPSNDEVLPRHGHGPSPQVAAGRLVIEGPHMLRATDIYTGLLLWQKALPGLGEFYNVTGHQPGANEIGSNFVSLEDAVYVVYGDKILELDPATGKTTREIKLGSWAGDNSELWGSIRATKDLLIATSSPAAIKGGKGLLDRLATKTFKPEQQYAVVKPNDQWRYLAGTDPDGDWTSLDFDDRNWKTGVAGFGYGDNDDRTLVDMKNKFSRLYLRKSFDGGATAIAGATKAVLQINYDDGFIAYLNGQEIARSGIRGGRGKDVSDVSLHEARGHETFEIENLKSLLKPKKNILAVEGHNVDLGSSDFSLDPALLIERTDAAKPKSTAKPPTAPGTAGLAKHFDPARYSSASRRLVVLDRSSGKVLWDRRAAYGFRHNNIAVGGGKVFCIDGLSSDKLALLNRRGVKDETYRPQLLALDAKNGKVAWSTDKNIFGTFLNYSIEHDVLLQAGSQNRDRAKDEVGTGMAVYDGGNGDVVWQDLKRSHSGPCMLHNDTIITQRTAYELLTGEPRLRRHPLTGELIPWRFTRNYGCNTAVAGQNLLTFRSAAAGFCDLAGGGGTGNFGGFKSSCTSNLIVAGGLLNAPEYTRTCSCNYQNQTSLAMVHDPDVEMWTFDALEWDGAPVRQVGINFGAPGNRRSAAGVLWLDYPSDSGPSPDPTVSVKPSDVSYVRHHSSLVSTDPADADAGWITASAIVGASEIRIGLCKDDDAPPRTYRVRLFFAEIAGAAPGERVFDVFLQGKKVVERLDVARQAGAMTTLIHEVPEVQANDELNIRLVPCDGARTTEPILSGVEIVAP